MLENNFEKKPDIEHLKYETLRRKGQEVECDSDDDERLGWMLYDSPIEIYDENFKEVLPENIEDLNSYIKSIYRQKKGKLIGIELGGPGKKLFANLAPEYFAKTAGFTLHKKSEDKENESKNGQHQIIEADVFSRRKKDDILPGYQNIEKWVKENGKADIIIEKMVAPIDSPTAEHLLLIIKRWYKLLNQGGTLFLEMPIYSHASKITSFLEKHQDMFEFQIDRNTSDDGAWHISGVYIRLRKLEGAPDSVDELLKDENLE